MTATVRKKPGRLVTARPLEPARIAAGDVEIDVIFRRHAQARRLVLRLDNKGTAALVTVPAGVSRTRALDFVARSADWLTSRLAKCGKVVQLAPGNTIPLRGEPHDICHIATRRGAVAVDSLARIIHVPGELPHVPRRLLDWLKTAARQELTASSRRYAEAMGVSFRRITIRDQKSRWGSCSAEGDLSYSWRLILAPHYVLDYVAAHEVAHLRHHNHGPQFWRLVLKMCPHASAAKKWLKAHGQSVHLVAAR
jgi:hypothetical protein